MAAKVIKGPLDAPERPHLITPELHRRNPEMFWPAHDAHPSPRRRFGSFTGRTLTNPVAKVMNPSAPWLLSSCRGRSPTLGAECRLTGAFQTLRWHAAKVGS
jgi:hypothetical protein